MLTSRWRDLCRLCTNLLRPGQQLVKVRYFTARVRGNPEAAARQGRYIDALRARGGLEIIEGSFLRKQTGCRACGRSWPVVEENGTDVALAVGLVEDGFRDVFDTALVISGDSDLAPAIETVSRLPRRTRIVAVFPRSANRRCSTGWRPLTWCPAPG